MFKDGKILEFYRGNVDPTKYDPSKNAKKRTGFRTMMPGLYEAVTYKRKNKSGLNEFSLSIDSKIGVLMNKKLDGSYLSWSILIHPGGMDNHSLQWNWSHGCQTIYQNDYEIFARRFGGRKDDQGNWVFDQSVYSKKGYYFLLTQ